MMPQNRDYPTKTRNIALAKPFPGKSRTIEVDKSYPSGPKARSGGDSGNKPSKGTLTSGGGHG